MRFGTATKALAECKLKPLHNLRVGRPLQPYPLTRPLSRSAQDLCEGSALRLSNPPPPPSPSLPSSGMSMRPGQGCLKDKKQYPGDQYGEWAYEGRKSATGPSSSEMPPDHVVLMGPAGRTSLKKFFGVRTAHAPEAGDQPLTRMGSSSTKSSPTAGMSTEPLQNHSSSRAPRHSCLLFFLASPGASILCSNSGGGWLFCNAQGKLPPPPPPARVPKILCLT